MERLRTVQRLLARLITDPGGVEAALAAEGDADGARLGGWIRDDRGLAPAQRVGIYAHAYSARLRDALRADYGALARALGEDAFHDLVETYLLAHPPAHPSLRHAGAQLAAHLAREPFAGIFARRCPYAADLARLEWAMADAFDAPDAVPIAREALAAVALDDWAELRFRTSPSLRLLACAWPVQRVRARFDAEEAEVTWDAAPPLAPEPTQIRVWRRDERVYQRAIATDEAAALEAAAAGETFGALCERIAAHAGEERAAERASALLGEWIAAGLLVGLG